MSFPPNEISTSIDSGAEVCQGSKYLVYCNTILSGPERFLHWYQILNISLAVAAVLVPALILLLRRLDQQWKRMRARKERSAETIHNNNVANQSTITVLDPDRNGSGSTLNTPEIKISEEEVIEHVDRIPSSLSSRSEKVVSSLNFHQLSERELPSFTLGRRKKSSARPFSTLSVRELCEDERRESGLASGSSSPGLPDSGVNSCSGRSSMRSNQFASLSSLHSDSWKSTESINMIPETDSEMAFNPLQNFDLRITPLFTKTGRRESRFSTSSRASGSAGFRKTVVGLVHLEDLGPDAFEENMLLDTVYELNMLRIEKYCTGLVLRIQDDVYPSQTMNLVDALSKQHIDVMLMCDTDASILGSIDFGSVIGVILENSTILPNGQRRDFFRSDRFRERMSRCASERVKRPTFFLGFNDVWDTRPTAAVVRRAFKIAEFFGATLSHGPVHKLGNPHSKFPVSMSGFDFLKSNDIVEVCTRGL
jgi:hypothetical protein